eukprot:COSAG05_NODE_12171_length_480_cov_0.803150_2_plen_24_part_01
MSALAAGTAQELSAVLSRALYIYT